MKLERIKSIILVLLIISSIALSSQIWFNEKLWPDGYNFFVSLKSTSVGQLFKNIGTKKAAKEAVQEDILVPYNFFVYMVKDLDHAGYMLTPKDESFSYAKNFLHTFIGDALSRANADNFTQIEESEWQSALCANGIYADYGAAYVTNTFLHLVNVTNSVDILEENIEKMGRFAVAETDSNIGLYINDLADNSFYKISYNNNHDELENIINSCVDRLTVDNRFSFFIGADRDSPIEGAAVFAPYIILSENNVEVEAATSASKDIINENISDNATNLTEIFSINPKTARRYTDAEESTVYVQNQASLKLSHDGYIEYQATTADGGLALRENANSQTSLALVLYPLVFLSEKINSQVSGNSNISVYVSSVTEKANKYTVTLDYSFNGLHYTEKSAGDTHNSITAEIEGGFLKSYKQYIASLQTTDSTVLLPSSYGGIDGIFSKMSLEDRNQKISDMFIGYMKESNGQVIPKWFIKTDADKIFYN